MLSLLTLGTAASAQICFHPGPFPARPSLKGIAFDTAPPYLKLAAADILGDQGNFLKALRNQLPATEAKCLEALVKPLYEAVRNKGDEVAANAMTLAILIRDVRLDQQPDSDAANIRLLTAYGVGIGKPVSFSQMLDSGEFPWTSKEFNDAVDKLTGGRNKPRFPFRPTPAAEIAFSEKLLASLWALLGKYFNANVNYGKTCKNNGVPVPKPLNVSKVPANPAQDYNGWHVANAATNGHLPGEQIVSYLQPPLNLIGDGTPRKLSVMYYWISKPADAQQGFCVANPITNDRNDPNNALVADAFGVICQSAPTTANPNTHACFWDNNGAEILSVDHDVNTADFVAPPNLPNNNQCTECHAGSHAFNVMPAFGMNENAWTPSAIEDAMTAYAEAVAPNGSYNQQRAALGKPKLLDFHADNVWYTPHVQPGWPQNLKPPAGASGPAVADKYPGACTGCHSSGGDGKVLAYLAGPANAQTENHYKFCSFMLPNFLTKTPHPALASSLDFYSPGTMSDQWSVGGTAVQKLYDTCKKIFPLATVNNMPNKPTYPLGPPATQAENPPFAVPVPSLTDWVKPAQNQM